MKISIIWFKLFWDDITRMFLERSLHAFSAYAINLLLNYERAQYFFKDTKWDSIVTIVVHKKIWINTLYISETAALYFNKSVISLEWRLLVFVKDY